MDSRFARIHNFAWVRHWCVGKIRGSFCRAKSLTCPCPRAKCDVARYAHEDSLRVAVFRLGFIAIFFLAVVSTAHFRLGRYAELTSEFGSAVLIMLIAFAVSTMLRVVRVVMGARRDAVFSRANSFGTAPPLGSFYSVRFSSCS